MPKIISYTPAWLSRPSPGFNFFSDSESVRKTSSERSNARNPTIPAPRRTIARRGTEVFIATENHIRWSDLCMLKDQWDERKAKANNELDVFNPVGHEVSERTYRVLKPPGSEKIEQLSISPDGSLLAILTSHTVHVAIVPDSSHLEETDEKPLKPKAYTVGPTTHVLSQSRVVRALWHPYGVSKRCLVTITADAAVRVWELDPSNRWSFDSPSLAIDLKKLLFGTSNEEDFQPNRIGQNKGFSSDLVGMEAVSACFGGTGSEEESPWSPMTLWVAMKDGDVYALCPLLPSKWHPSATLLPSLSAAAVSKNTANDDMDQCKHDQYRWISDLDSQEPKLVHGESELAPLKEIYKRPSDPGPIPKLQGPFQIYPEDLEEDMELSDIHVIAAKLNIEELMQGEDFGSEPDMSDEEGLSTSIVCLMTRSGRIHICLDLDGVEGEWLPRKNSGETLPSKDLSLVPFEVLDTLDSDSVCDDEWPTFTPDVLSRYSFFVTHSKGVYYFSLEPWLQSLESEFQNESSAGTSFRLNLIKTGSGTLRERIIRFDQDTGYVSTGATPACVVFQDSDIGYFLLTSAGEQPQAALLDQPNQNLPEPSVLDDEYDYQLEPNAFTLPPTRSVYQPPPTLWAQSSLPDFIDRHIPNRQKRMMKDEVRHSAATLSVMTELHRITSEETHRLGVAVADLFRRCERLQDELHHQIKLANEVAGRIESIINFKADQKPSNAETVMKERLQSAIAKQEDLLHRHDRLRRKVVKFGGRKLNKKEQQWISETQKMGESLLEPDPNQDTSDDNDNNNNDNPPSLKPWQRYNEIKSLTDHLTHRASQINQENPCNTDTDSQKPIPTNIPLEIRKAKVVYAQSLLEKETMLLNAAMSRFKRLSLTPLS